VDAELEAICLRCLEKAPSRRYATAAALADDVESWLAGEPTRVRPPSLPTLMGRWLRKNIRAVVWVAIFGLLCGSVAGLAEAQTLAPLHRSMQRIYEKFPSLERPALALDLPAPPWLRTAAPYATLLALVALGPGAVFLLRSRDRWADAAAGLAAGAAAGLAALVFIGPSLGVALVVVPSISDNTLLAMGFATRGSPVSGRDAARQPHPQDQLLDQYPDLARLEEGERAPTLFSKVAADQVNGCFLALWAGLLLVCGGCSALGLVEAVAAGHLLRAGGSRLSGVVTYLECALFSGCGLLVSWAWLATSAERTMIKEEGPRLFALNSVQQANALPAIAGLALLSILGVLLRRNVSGRWAAYLTWLVAWAMAMGVVRSGWRSPAILALGFLTSVCLLVRPRAAAASLLQAATPITPATAKSR
jgi:hypothetical protein